MSILFTRNFVASLCCSLLTMSPVWADDTEIFFGDYSDGEVAPNVLFIVDTSGSMSNTVSGTGMTRMQNVQAALKTLLTGLNAVNVGIMRFSNPGGPVLYQVDYIDRNVNDPTDQITDVRVSIRDNDDDAQQITGTGKMIFDSRRIEMTSLLDGETDILTESVSSSSDDAEEQTWKSSGDNISRTSGDLEMTHDDGDEDELHVVGVRFSGIEIPRGATISDAFVSFEQDNTTSGPMEVRITAEVRDTGSFTNDHNNISSRTKTSAYADWNLSGPVAVGEIVETSDLTALVQEVIDHPDWSDDGATEENDIVFVFSRRPETPATLEDPLVPASTVVGEYDFRSYDDNGRGEPQLTVEYYTAGTPTKAQATTGLRFQTVSVPRNATIVSASLEFTVAQADSGEVSDLVIYGEDIGHSPVFSTSNKVESRTKTSDSTNWSPGTWDTINTVQTSEDLTSIVQSIVDRSDWCGSNAMTFIIEGNAGALRSAYSRDADNGYQPELHIQFEADSISPGDTCAVSTVSKRIVSSEDDVEEVGNTVYTSSSNLEFDNSTSVGLRYTNMNLPADAPIQAAYIEIDPYNSWNAAGTYSIEVENTGDAAPFTTANGTVDDRSWHSTSVSWTVNENWDSQSYYRSVDISSLLQQVVDHADWSLGNDLAFRIRKTSGSERQVESYDQDPVDAPLLVVQFEDDGTETNILLVRDELMEVVDNLNTRGFTPIQDTLYEAALYYTGGDVDYGAYRGGPNDSGPHEYTRVSIESSMVDGTYRMNTPPGCSEDNLGAAACETQTINSQGSKDPLYKSPIDDWCQTNNHIILLTDGQANRPHSDDKIATFIDGSCDNTGLSEGEYCVKDLVSYMYETDQSDLKETQRITTHTIGFNFSSQWLEDVATAGGGQYRVATQASDLVEEIGEILTAVLKTNSSFVAPVAAINQFNRLNHRSEIYFAVFRPDETPNWPGNLKKYRLRESDNTILDFSSTAGAEAINVDTGFFTDTAQSAWGGVQDGQEVHVSGANSKMPAYASRNVYTHYTGSSSTVLSNSANELATSNGSLTKAMFGVETMSDTEFDEHIEWILGKDVDDADGDLITAENRYLLGDPLHSKPIAVTYGGTESEPDITIFFGTNAGLLHAVDSDSGVERFAFLPEENAQRQVALREQSTTQAHIYGVDGSVTPWVHDDNGNGVISGDDDFVYIYFGMRRGGRNYYAMDVTDRDNPEIMWTITGGEGDFVELGQTWSQPVLGTIDIDGTDTDVLYFSGGYDEDQDGIVSRAEDDVGRAIYIVNAKTGALIWSGGNGVSYTEDFDDMLYSIPADLSVLDVTSSGHDNMIFVGDTGGQVWRFDINNGAALEDLITGSVVADLGVAAGDNTEVRNRRFYHAPDVALLKIDNTVKLAVTIGSGFHAHPLSIGTVDRFYMFLQDNVFSAPTSYTKLTEADLYDATDNDVGEGVDGAAALLAVKKGWYFDMSRSGEKVLSTPLTFKGTVTFTSYEPNPNSVTSNCIPAAGVTRVYQINLEDASPTNDWDDVDGLTENDRSVTLQTSSIIDEPVIICTGAGCDMFVGAEKPPVDVPNSKRVVKTFWRKDN